MIDIPLNKALAAVEVDDKGVCERHCDAEWICRSLACDPEDRKDGKNVIFKLVDLPEGQE